MEHPEKKKQRKSNLENHTQRISGLIGLFGAKGTILTTPAKITRVIFRKAEDYLRHLINRHINANTLANGGEGLLFCNNYFF